MTFVRQFYARWQMLVHEVAKFGIVGAVCYVIDFGLFNVFHFAWGWGPITSKTLSTIIAATVNYFANRHWSFAPPGAQRHTSRVHAVHRAELHRPRRSRWRSSRFGHYVLKQTSPLATNIWGNVVGTGMATFFRFWAYKKFVFLHPDHPKAQTAAEPARRRRAVDPVDTPKNVA